VCPERETGGNQAGVYCTAHTGAIDSCLVGVNVRMPRL